MISYCSISVADVIKENFLQNWSDMMKIQKPIIAAVSGFAVRLIQAHSPEVILIGYDFL